MGSPIVKHRGEVVEYQHLCAGNIGPYLEGSTVGTPGPPFVEIVRENGDVYYYEGPQGSSGLLVGENSTYIIPDTMHLEIR